MTREPTADVPEAPRTDAPVMRLRGVTKIYGRKPVLDRLDLRTCPELIESLFDRAAPWSLVIVTARDDIKTRCDRVVEWS